MKTLERKHPLENRGFTLVELMVSTTIISLLMVVLTTMVNQFSQTWRYASSKVASFQAARDGFESMTRKLSQATLNTYWDLYYVNIGGRQAPKDFVRQSQLRFVCGPMSRLAPDKSRLTHGIFFQAPLGMVDDNASLGPMDNLLNTWGYFIEEGDDTLMRPSFLNGRVPVRHRSRLMELMQPAEAMSVYDLDPKGAQTPLPGDQLSWFRPALTANPRPVRAIADNIVALIIWPKLANAEAEARRDQGKSPLSPNYLYDSSLLTFKSQRYGSAISPVYLNEGAKLVTASDPQEAADINPKNQLPPIVQVTMVAVDEPSAARTEDGGVKDGIQKLTQGLFEIACPPGTRSNGETQYNKDVKEMEQRMVNAKMTYRIFQTNVLIRGAKWSTSQTK
jgi:uncharacterized protein (TIGR02599 family)